MKNNPSTAAYNAVTYIVSCVLSGLQPDAALISRVPTAEIYSAANSMSLIAIVTDGLESCGIFSERASQMKMLAARKAMLFDAERGEIEAELEKRGIKHMALKGVILKELYPSVYHRQMADNDILFDEKYRETIRDIMLSRGYEVEIYNQGNHDVYIRKPVYNFEMHVSLFSGKSYEEYAKFYSAPFSMAIKGEGAEYGYRFSDEDFYVYIKAHEYKHFSAGGTGLRSLVDTYVFLNAKKDTLDMDKVSQSASALGLSLYEQRTRELSMKVFAPETARALLAFDLGEGDDPLTETERALLYDFYFVGTYGTTENSVSNNIAKASGGVNAASKAKYLFRKLFPDKNFYICYNHNVEKKPYLIPFIWFSRMFRFIFKSPADTVRKIKTVIKSKEKKNNVR